MRRSWILAALALAGCKEDGGPGSLKLDLSACMRVTEAGSCGQALADRYSDDVTLCVAVRTGAGDQVLPALADRNSGALAAAPGAEDLELSASSEQATLRVFYLAPGTEPSACTTDAFTVATPCSADVGCVIATGAVLTEVAAGGTTVKWGKDADAACAFDCGDPAFCGAAGASAAELCDQIDNDCDGLTDEGFSLEPDVCDQIDNDCDGDTDEDSRDQPEVCNGDDDDCDGETDEGVTPPQGDGRLGEPCSAGEGACERLGVYVCDDAGAAVVCGAEVDAAEAIDLCGNGIDEDCDGLVDEGFGDEGEAAMTECVVGVGACRRQGVFLCNEETGLYDQCSVQAGAAAGVETCGNRVDDDCNGTPDDGCDCVPGSEQTCFDGAPENEGVGKCRLGNQQCNANGSWTTCEGSVLPSVEICDGLDDDCDGETDEDLDLGVECTVGEGVCGRAGQLICNPEEGRTDVVCSVEPGPAREGGEICDGLDNDCDGEVDDAPLEDAGDACSAGVGACEVAGLEVCRQDPDDAERYEVVCDAEPGDPAEIESCDGLDNDCDNETDEPPYDNTGGDCEVGVGECLQAGTTICDTDAGEPACDAVPLAPADAETCDGLDNTCVGTVDVGCDDDEDGFCDRALEYAEDAACLPGDCDDSVETGADVHPGVEDLNNDIDDDCDDLIDEGFSQLTFNRNWTVGLPRHQDLSVNGIDFTVEAWVYVDGFHSAATAPILSRRDPGIVEDGYMFGITGNCGNCNNSKCRPFFMGGDGQEKTWVIDNSPPNNCTFPLFQWVHLAATFERGDGPPNHVRVFQDGVLIAEDEAFPIDLPVSEILAVLGEDQLENGRYFNGKIADLRISSVLRYPSDDPVPACLQTDEATLFHWRLSEGAGDEARDSGPSAVHGAVLPALEAEDRWSDYDGCALDR